MKKILLLCLAVLTINIVDGQNHIGTQKTIADAIAVKNALDALTRNGANPAIQPLANEIGNNLEELSKLETGFVHYSLPITLMINSKNKKAVLKIEKELSTNLSEVREMVKLVRNQFEIDQYPIVQTLLSENPGDYYSAINPSYSYNLSNHPFRSKIEELCLQDFSFNEMASGDTALWNMGSSCPHLKRIYLFGAALTINDIRKMNLNEIKSLEVIDLSENNITELPTNFNINNNLIYLSLAKNQLEDIGKSYHNWTNLRYLNLKGNKIPASAIKNLEKTLPQLKVIY